MKDRSKDRSEITVAIVFGGGSPEHDESITATRNLYKYGILNKLENRYNFKYFYLTEEHRWADKKTSKKMVQIKNWKPEGMKSSGNIPKSLQNCHLIYNTMMGSCGENGNIMGLADILTIRMIGCDILASAIALDKFIAKKLVQSCGIPVVDYLYVDRKDNTEEILTLIDKNRIGYPCFVKPTNLGTCYFIFKAQNKDSFVSKWKNTTKENELSQKYLIEKFIPNTEVRVFVFEDLDGNLITNDGYVTTLKEEALETGGVMFDHIDNSLSVNVRSKVKKYAIQIYKLFQMKDYGRVDFFVEKGSERIYFNEANTQPFLSGYNFKLMKKQNGISCARFLNTMIRRNLRDS